MKLAIISDIHANPVALLSVLADIERQNCSRIVCLGDLVGYGYDPNACIDICRERGIECFLGNHDAGLISRISLDWFNQFASDAVVRQRPLVSQDNKKWLAHLHYNKMEGAAGDFPYAFAHGVFVNQPNIILPASAHFEYINGYSDAALQFLTMATLGIRTLFVGHTHYANAYIQDSSGGIKELFIDLEDEQPIDLSKYRMSIVNVGSVGYPRNQPYSIYGIYDTETHEFRHRTLPFDYDDYEAQMKSADAPLPRWFPALKKEAEDRQIGFR